MNDFEFNHTSHTPYPETGVRRSEENLSVDPLDKLDIQESLTAVGEELFFSAEASIIHRQALDVPLQPATQNAKPKLSFESIETHDARSHHTQIAVPGITLKNDSGKIDDPDQTNTWQKFTHKGEFAGFLDRDELIIDLCTALPNAVFLRSLLDQVNVTDKMVIDSLWNDTQATTGGWKETRVWNTISTPEDTAPLYVRGQEIQIENLEATIESSISLVTSPSKRTFAAVERQVVDSIYQGSGDNDEWYYLDPFSGSEGEVNLGQDMIFETEIKNTDAGEGEEPVSTARLALRSPNMSKSGLELLNVYASRRLDNDNLLFKIYTHAITAVADAHLAPKLPTVE